MTEPRKKKAAPRKRAAAKKAAPRAASTNGRQVSDSQKAAMAEGRQQSTTVRKYLDALEALNGPKRRGRQRTPEALRTQIDAVNAKMDKADPVTRVKLIQQRMQLHEQLAALTNVETIDITAVEEQFKKVAKVFSERQGITFGAWREFGVPAQVLKEAGVGR